MFNTNISCTCPHNMVNFGPLAAEIVSLVWGTPGNFNRFRVLAALLHGTLVVGVSQTAALNRRCHLYSAGRPSRWALAHISSLIRIYSRGWQLSSSKCIDLDIKLFLASEVAEIFCGLGQLSQLNLESYNCCMYSCWVVPST